LPLRAVSFALWRTQDRFLELKIRASLAVARNIERYSQLCADFSNDSVAVAMQKTFELNVWGSTIQLFAVADAISLPLIVFSPKMDQTREVRYQYLPALEGQGGEAIVLVNTHTHVPPQAKANHFVPLLPAPKISLVTTLKLSQKTQAADVNDSGFLDESVDQGEDKEMQRDASGEDIKKQSDASSEEGEDSGSEEGYSGQEE